MWQRCHALVWTGLILKTQQNLLVYCTIVMEVGVIGCITSTTSPCDNPVVSGYKPRPTPDGAFLIYMYEYDDNLHTPDHTS